jgi:phosphate transport system substrate-binding protein
MQTSTFALVLLPALALACTGGDGGAPRPGHDGAPSASTSSSGALVGAGSTFVAPLMSRWIADYGASHAGARIDYQAIGSGAGIRQITERTVDFGATDAPMTDEQIAKAPGVLHIPLCLGAVVLAYHLDGVPAGLKLSREAIAGVFLGAVKTWDDPLIAKENEGAKLPAAAIAVVHRSDGSGTTKLFADFLSAASPAWRSGPGSGTSLDWPVGLGAKGNDGVAAQVKSTPGAIGYVELAYAMQNRLTFASVQAKGGAYVAPTLESTTAAGAAGAAAADVDHRVQIVDVDAPGAYPISGIAYALVYTEQKDAAKGKLLVDFLKWATHDGQGKTAALSYAALPGPAVARADADLAKVTGPGGAPLGGK